MTVKVLKYILTLTAILFMAACSSDEYVGGEVSKESSISFDGSQSKTTRTESQLSQFVNSFIVYGVKTIDSNPQTVFNNYTVRYTENSQNTTASNTAGWEYVGENNQSIKYWDYSASNYMFWAVAPADKLSSGFTLQNGLIPSATLTIPSGYDPNASNALIYYTAPKSVSKTDFNKTVKLEFLTAASRIRFGFYETIPGYAVKDMQFYVTDESSINVSPSTSFIANCEFATSGNLKITYDNDNFKASVDWETTTSSQYPTTDNSKEFGALNYASGVLGTMSSNPTYAGSTDAPGYYKYILPYPQNDTPLTIRCDYTLQSTDGSGQTINVEGATGIVPAEYCQWKANYSYTYLFKISDNSNGSTGGDVIGLYPITFTAFSEMPGTDNNQIGTITTVGEWNITTHQKNDVLNNGIVYYKLKETEVSAIEGGTENSKVVLNGTTDYVVIYHQLTNYEWKVETTESTSTEPKEHDVYLETIDRYEDGFAYFTPDVPGTYRIEYWHKEGSQSPEKRAIKIMKVEDRNGFNIHYVLNGHGTGVTDVEGTQKIPDAGDLPVPSEADRCWNFLGWFINETLTEPVVPGTVLTDDITLYAKWQKVFTGEDLEDTNMNE